MYCRLDQYTYCTSGGTNIPIVLQAGLIYLLYCRRDKYIYCTAGGTDIPIVLQAGLINEYKKRTWVRMKQVAILAGEVDEYVIPPDIAPIYIEDMQGDTV